MGIPKMQGQANGKTMDEAGRANEHAGFERLADTKEASDGSQQRFLKMRKNGRIQHKSRT
ncbi:MAG: hypothetical protein Q7V00_00055 [Sulfurimicrobium sp.]|nr:hypothetical protein [Sulfurimicrobium sp.]MDP1705145.1 hypothetical protein [Sulfurimicrobium sp.]MDP2198071.1 hypothetical protein [Sulfurimicrobium sp.]MDP3686884.1 hypothetical protein [Sulfurimicrobium sp.]